MIRASQFTSRYLAQFYLLSKTDSGVIMNQVKVSFSGEFSPVVFLKKKNPERMVEENIGFVIHLYLLK